MKLYNYQNKNLDIRFVSIILKLNKKYLQMSDLKSV